jgi:hypothetical protein
MNAAGSARVMQTDRGCLLCVRESGSELCNARMSDAKNDSGNSMNSTRFCELNAQGCRQ